MLGLYFSILKIEKLIHNSPLKFFTELYITLSLRNLERISVIISLADVFQILQVTHITVGLCLEIYLLANFQRSLK